MRYKHLALEERCLIDQLGQDGYSCRQIALKLNRDHTTISRELKRNSTEQGYQYRRQGWRNPSFTYSTSMSRVSRALGFLRQSRRGTEGIQRKCSLNSYIRFLCERCFLEWLSPFLMPLVILLFRKTLQREINYGRLAG